MKYTIAVLLLLLHQKETTKKTGVNIVTSGVNILISH